MEQVVRTYPSPVSPMKPANPEVRADRDPRGGVYTPPSRLSPHRLSPEPRRSPPRQSSPAVRGVAISSPVDKDVVRGNTVRRGGETRESKLTDKQVEKTQKQINQLKGK